MTQEILLRDGSRTADPRLDRLIQFDERSREFPVRTILPTTKLVSRSWGGGLVLNQVNEGSCVGQAWAKEAACLPVAVPRITEKVAVSIYREAQKIDEFPDDVPYEGTSTIAGAKVMVKRGYINGYRWAFTIDDVLSSLSNLGPVVIGIWWYESMYETRANGLVVAEGQKVGGHCITLTGISLQKWFVGETKALDVVEWTNSWGPSYGIRGKGYIPFALLEKLLKDQGEACVPVGRKLPRVL